MITMFTSNSETKIQLNTNELITKDYYFLKNYRICYIPTLKFVVTSVGHVNSLGNIMYIGMKILVATLPSPIWILCISVTEKFTHLALKSFK